MYNLILLAAKPSDWTHDEFIEWWRGEHADMTYALPGLRRWHHTEVLEAMDDNHSAGWDGMSVLSFDSKDDLDAALASEEWGNAVAHVGTMRGRRIAVMGEERVMVPEG
ncbi:EthD family reductase [Nocardioides panacisoli]|uniref:EthD family reductase n=1 Tax=Nocardioides panacisoli TaxID=627624 RepID=UPI001C63B3AC|nr:EthD family reductase [Nocardioides panacisoli]QYJ03588.1 EthD family reductase [Nocardioides panacisoli]